MSLNLRPTQPRTGLAVSRLLRACALGALIILSSATAARPAPAAKRKSLAGRSAAVVIDERLAALRRGPDLNSPLVRRLGRGSVVRILGARRTADGVAFYRVVVTGRTGGWLQAESVAVPARGGDDRRLLELIRASEGFDRLARARIFLDAFPKSPLRPQALALYGEAAEESADRLSRDARRRLDGLAMTANTAPLHSYFLNYSGLDRYARAGVLFTFDRDAKRFHYDGASWREILRRHPRSPEAADARRRLDTLSSLSQP